MPFSNKRLRILLITSEEWNDYVYANGVLTNWFTGFDADFAQIYTSPGRPLNQVCNKYFQIDEKAMVKSLLSKRRAGRVTSCPVDKQSIEQSKQNQRRKGIYLFFKRISLHFSTAVQLLRDSIWMTGRYDLKEMERFISEFNPDLVFCPRKISPKLIRLEKIVSGMTNAPFVAFTGDDEASLDGFSFSPLFWIRKFWIHKLFKKHVGLYAHYLTHSEDQAREYFHEYGVNTSMIYKCGDFSKNLPEKNIGDPIRLVYAGRLYCNRWRSLEKIGNALKRINESKVRMILEVYTQDTLSRKQRKALTEDKYIYLKGSVDSYKLKEIYRQADIALHVESMDRNFRIVTRVSFSTKIIDLLDSTCAVMAICWERHCGYQYLQKHDAAFCISRYDEILPQLKDICDNPSLIPSYARKAYACGQKNHSRAKIQSSLLNLFRRVISNSTTADN